MEVPFWFHQGEMSYTPERKHSEHTFRACFFFRSQCVTISFAGSGNAQAQGDVPDGMRRAQLIFKTAGRSSHLQVWGFGGKVGFGGLEACSSLVSVFFCVCGGRGGVGGWEFSVCAGVGEGLLTLGSQPELGRSLLKPGEAFLLLLSGGHIQRPLLKVTRALAELHL